jgi:hypothetical protein
MTRKRATDDTGDSWHRVDVCCSAALARTRVSVLGVLDTHAIEAVDHAVRTAKANAHAVTLELHEISSVTPHALNALLTRERTYHDRSVL